MAKHHLVIKFLGTGANGGIPQIDCRCKNCTSNNKRLRSSVLIETSETKLLLDCGPDVKQQIESQNLKLQDISGIAISHLHWDHSIGFTELSAGKKLEIPIFVPSIIKKSLLDSTNFSFLFKFDFAKFNGKNPNSIAVKFIPVVHDPNFDTFAIRLTSEGKNILFCPDIAVITENILKEIRRANLVIFDGTFLSTSRHNHIAMQKSAPILANNAKNVIFTHINHSEDPKKIETFLKQFKFKLAFDGMKIKL